MNLSKRSEYALRALIDLGIARELGRPILQVAELSAKEKLPKRRGRKGRPFCRAAADRGGPVRARLINPLAGRPKYSLLSLLD